MNYDIPYGDQHGEQNSNEQVPVQNSTSQEMPDREDDIDAESEKVIRELIGNLSEVSPSLTTGITGGQLVEMESLPSNTDRIVYAHKVLGGEPGTPVSEEKARVLEGVFARIGSIRDNKALARLSATLFAFVAFAGAIGSGVESAEQMDDSAHAKIENALNDGHLKIGGNINLRHSEQRYLASWLDKHPEAVVNIEKQSIDASAQDREASATYELQVREDGQLNRLEGNATEAPSNVDQWIMGELTAAGLGSPATFKWSPMAETMARNTVREQALEDALKQVSNQ